MVSGCTVCVKLTGFWSFICCHSDRNANSRNMAFKLWRCAEVVEWSLRSDTTLHDGSGRCHRTKSHADLHFTPELSKHCAILAQRTRDRWIYFRNVGWSTSGFVHNWSRLNVRAFLSQKTKWRHNSSQRTSRPGCCCCDNSCYLLFLEVSHIL